MEEVKMTSPQQSPRKRSSFWLIFLLLLFAGWITLSFQGAHGASVWWVPLFLLAGWLFCLREFVFRPHHLLRTLGVERVRLNLDSSGDSHLIHHKKLPRVMPYVLHFLVLTVPLVSLVGPFMGRNVHDFAVRLREALEPARLQVEIEPPSYSQESQLRRTLSVQSPEAVRVLSGSFISLRLAGGRGLRSLLNSWEEQRDEPTGVLTVYPLNLDTELTPELLNKLHMGRIDAHAWKSAVPWQDAWQGSTELLSEALGADLETVHRMALFVESGRGKLFVLDLTMDPIPRPQVTLELPPEEPRQAQDQLGVLFFNVEVLSQTPLTEVAFLARTESGYSFRLPIGEFAGTERHEFSHPQAQLQTMGIPFGENDALYVKAIAETVISGLIGESKEFRFPVKSPAESRRKLIEQVENLVDRLQNPDRDFQSFKQDLNNQLTEALKTAQDLGRQSLAARKLQDMKRNAQRLTASDQETRERLEAQAQDLLETLKRSQAREEANSWFLKMREFLNQLAQREFATHQQQLVERSDGLTDEAEDLKLELENLIEAPQSGLTLEEKQLAMELIESDETPLRMGGVSELINQGDRAQALQLGRETYEKALENLGGVLQLITIARNRMIRDAQEKLQQADAALEEVRQASSPEDQKEQAEAAQRTLEKTPSISHEFEEALEQAQAGARGVRRSLSRQGKPQLTENLNEAQQAIARALAALQQEEQASREEQSQEEGRRYRSAMDAMSAQGAMDSGWRRKIFEEISRLREAGVPADADVIRFLESRLR